MTTIRNPVVAGFNPDPSVCRVGDDYYLATSTFEYVPGVPILHSRDLVNWTTIGHAVPDLVDLHQVNSSQGIFAPTLRHIAGRFVMITTVMPSGRNFLTTADDPAGPWSAPVDIVGDGPGMDPSLFEDTDGTVYYTRHGDGRHGAIYQATIDVETGRLDAAPREIWRGTGGIWPEGPHLYRYRDAYYVLISEGGTSYDHSLTVARSASPWGPFEPCPDNPILTHRGRPDHPIQAVGHADLVDTPDGEWFAVLLGIRPLDRVHHLGRETFLAPVVWRDGWPRVGPVELVLDAPSLPSSAGETPAESVEHVDFSSRQTLGPEWIGLRTPFADRCESGEHGLVLQGRSTTIDDDAPCTFIGRRQQDFSVEISASVDFDPTDDADAAGLVIRLDEERHIDLLVRRRGGRRVVTVDGRGPDGPFTAGELAVDDGPVELVITATPHTYACGVRTSSTTIIGEVPTRNVAISEAERFTGVVIGMYVTSRVGSTATFGWFRAQPDTGSDVPPDPYRGD
jgi:alpha-N-arabinofuranosidase